MSVRIRIIGDEVLVVRHDEPCTLDIGENCTVRIGRLLIKTDENCMLTVTKN